MKGSDLLRIVDQMHHEKNIPREVIFDGIEAALQPGPEFFERNGPGKGILRFLSKKFRSRFEYRRFEAGGLHVRAADWRRGCGRSSRLDG